MSSKSLQSEFSCAKVSSENGSLGIPLTFIGYEIDGKEIRNMKKATV
jgi:hypothetical protein